MSQEEESLLARELGKAGQLGAKIGGGGLAGGWGAALAPS